MSATIQNCICLEQCHYDCTNEACACIHHVWNFEGNRKPAKETFPEFWNGFGKRMMDAGVAVETIAQCAWNAAKAGETPA
jgi:hypothetical protein